MQNCSETRTERRSLATLSHSLAKLPGSVGSGSGSIPIVTTLPATPSDSYLRLFQDADGYLREAVQAAEEGDHVGTVQLTTLARLNVRLGGLLLRVEQENDAATLNILA